MDNLIWYRISMIILIMSVRHRSKTIKIQSGISIGFTWCHAISMRVHYFLCLLFDGIYAINIATATDLFFPPQTHRIYHFIQFFNAQFYDYVQVNADLCVCVCMCHTETEFLPQSKHFYCNYYFYYFLNVLSVSQALPFTKLLQQEPINLYIVAN